MSHERLALGTRKGLLIFQRRGSDWSLGTEAFLGVHVSLIQADPRNGWLYACLDHGHWGCKLHRSKEGGSTWEEIEAPKYPADALLGANPLAETTDPGADQNQPAVLRYLWALGFGAESQTGRIYVGTEPGGLFVSDDGGDSFQLVKSLWDHPSRAQLWFGAGRDHPGIHSILVDPRNPRKIIVGVSCAGVFISEDDGQSWEPHNQGLKAEFLPNPDAEIGHDPHLVTQCQSQPDVLWQQNHCGIFRSIDCGRHWTDVSEQGGPAGFGFAIAVDPHNADRAWVVPAESDQERVAIGRQLCVCRTENGGQTWHAYRDGLPQENCYDFAFRHGLDLSGDSLAFATASGSCYLSDDQGESWRLIAGHLPPVYSARFI